MKIPVAGCLSYLAAWTGELHGAVPIAAAALAAGSAAASLASSCFAVDSHDGCSAAEAPSFANCNPRGHIWLWRDGVTAIGSCARAAPTAGAVPSHVVARRLLTLAPNTVAELCLPAVSAALVRLYPCNTQASLTWDLLRTAAATQRQSVRVVEFHYIAAAESRSGGSRLVVPGRSSHFLAGTTATAAAAVATEDMLGFVCATWGPGVLHALRVHGLRFQSEGRLVVHRAAASSNTLSTTGSVGLSVRNAAAILSDCTRLESLEFSDPRGGIPLRQLVLATEALPLRVPQPPQAPSILSQADGLNASHATAGIAVGDGAPAFTSGTAKGGTTLRRVEDVPPSSRRSIVLIRQRITSQRRRLRSVDSGRSYARLPSTTVAVASPTPSVLLHPTSWFQSLRVLRISFTTGDSELHLVARLLPCLEALTVLTVLCVPGATPITASGWLRALPLLLNERGLRLLDVDDSGAGGGFSGGVFEGALRQFLLTPPTRCAEAGVTADGDSVALAQVSGVDHALEPTCDDRDVAPRFYFPALRVFGLRGPSNFSQDASATLTILAACAPNVRRLTLTAASAETLLVAPRFAKCTALHASCGRMRGCIFAQVVLAMPQLRALELRTGLSGAELSSADSGGGSGGPWMHRGLRELGLSSLHPEIAGVTFPRLRRFTTLR